MPSKPSIPTICEWCGKTFLRVKLSTRTRRFCTKKCATQHQWQGRRWEPRENYFWKRVRKTENCWIWTGGHRESGYGTMTEKTEDGHFYLKLAHRFSWKIHNGPIPNGMFICHHCDNPTCVRPDHLFIGTPKDNTQDSVKKGRHTPFPVLIGTANPQHKLTNEQVREIRKNIESHAQAAARFGVTKSLICAIRRGRVWKHLI